MWDFITDIIGDIVWGGLKMIGRGIRGVCRKVFRRGKGKD